MTVSSNNSLHLCGKLIDAPVFSHASHGENFKCFTLAIERLSKAYDTINVLANETLLEGLELTTGDFVSIAGELRSFNNKTGVGNRLIVTAFAKEISHGTTEYVNELSLTGTLCKSPIYRRTPLGREICDLMLAINRKYGRSDYLPCIAWGKNALIASEFPTGSVLNITGRIQSRDYIKLIDGIEHQKTTYEVSISSVSQSNPNTIIS